MQRLQSCDILVELNLLAFIDDKETMDGYTGELASVSAFAEPNKSLIMTSDTQQENSPLLGVDANPTLFPFVSSKKGKAIVLSHIDYNLNETTVKHFVQW